MQTNHGGGELGMIGLLASKAVQGIYNGGRVLLKQLAIGVPGIGVGAIAGVRGVEATVQRVQVVGGAIGRVPEVFRLAEQRLVGVHLVGHNVQLFISFLGEWGG